jgi:hypothetical protein
MAALVQECNVPFRGKGKKTNEGQTAALAEHTACLELSEEEEEEGGLGAIDGGGIAVDEEKKKKKKKKKRSCYVKNGISAEQALVSGTKSVSVAPATNSKTVARLAGLATTHAALEAINKTAKVCMFCMFVCVCVCVVSA